MKTKKVIIAVLLAVLLLTGCLTFYQPDERCLPPHIKNKKHTDYTLPGTKWIPFWATSWCFVEPPIMLLGNQKQRSVAANGQLGSSPIPEPGTWQLSMVQLKKQWVFTLPYFALTTKTGFHFRIGCRWDNVDHYFVFPSIAARHLKEYRHLQSKSPSLKIKIWYNLTSYNTSK